MVLINAQRNQSHRVKPIGETAKLNLNKAEVASLANY